MSKILYKFLNGNESENGDHTWEIGKWYEVEGKLKMCQNGFHASEHVQDALSYVQGNTLIVVEVDGKHISGDDKQCWQKMRVVETYDWTPIHSVKLAIYSAKIANDGYDQYGCIGIAEKILKKMQSGEEIPDSLFSAAARAATWAAEAAAWTAWAAESAESAEVAAWASVRAATWAAEAAEAARATVRAAWAARAAVRAAESAHQTEIKQKIHEYCLSIVCERYDTRR